MKSIMQQKDGTCYLCAKLHQDYSSRATEEHHVIYGTSGRRLSERYGLKVYLCEAHHRTGKEAVHFNADIAADLKDEAQRAFEKHFPELDFFSIFGKNYKLDRAPKKERNETMDGFILLGDNENGNDKG